MCWWFFLFSKTRDEQMSIEEKASPEEATAATPLSAASNMISSNADEFTALAEALGSNDLHIGLSTNALTTLGSGDGSITTISGYGQALLNGAGGIPKEVLVQLSNFEMCAEINYLVGNTVNATLETAEAQKKVIACEWKEFLDSIEAKDLHTLRDDVGDMLFTVYGMAARMGYPADLDFKKICESQYSKFDRSLEDAQKTRQKYLDIGVETYFEEKRGNDDTLYFVTYSAMDQMGSDNKHYPAGKWLKSVNFKEPEFTPWQPKEA